MAKTLQEKAQDIAVDNGLHAEAVEVKKGTSRSVITVTLENGRKISTDSVKGWEQTLDAHIRKFKDKK